MPLNTDVSFCQSCVDCKCPIVMIVCNSPFTAPLDEHTYWYYCSNPCCVNHKGEGHHEQTFPEFMRFKKEKEVIVEKVYPVLSVEEMVHIITTDHNFNDRIHKGDFGNLRDTDQFNKLNEAMILTTQIRIDRAMNQQGARRHVSIG